MDNAEIGKIALKNQASAVKADALADISQGIKTKNDSMIEAAEKRLAAANNIISGIEQGAVSKKDITDAGIKTPHINTDVSGKYPKSTVDFDSMGESVKAQEISRMDENIKNIRAARAAKRSGTTTESTQSNNGSSTGDVDPHKVSTPDDIPSKPKSKAAFVLGGILGALGFSEGKDFFSSSPRTAPDVGEDVNIPSQPAFGSPGALDIGFNALNATGAVMEMRGGASRNIASLGSSSAYISGGKQVVGDFLETASIKSIGSEFVEHGGMAAGKALGKSALKKLPLVGVGLGAAFAYKRADGGDFVGAAMEFASGAVSLIPGIGTAASVAIDGALMKRDYDANNPSSSNPTVPSTENNVTPVPNNAPSFGGSNATSVSANTSSNSMQAENVPQNTPLQNANPTSTTQSTSTATPNATTSNTPQAAQTSNTAQAPQANNMNNVANEPLSSSSIRDNFNTLSNNIGAMDNNTAGEEYLNTVTPSNNREAVIQEAKAGTLTRTKMINSGIPRDIVEQTPINEEGFVSLEGVGSMYKEGISSLGAVLNIPNHPSFKFGSGAAASLGGSALSGVAASSIMMGHDASMITAPLPTAVQSPLVATTQTTTVDKTTQVGDAQQGATIIKETILMNSDSNISGGTISIDSSIGNIQESARSTASPGNIQVQQSDIKRSI